jgi:uncharacterized membrane protein
MKPTFKFLRTTLVGGILFLAPLMVLVIILEKALTITHEFVDPLAKHLPIHSAIGLRTPMFLAAGLIVVFCFLTGFIARTVLLNFPGYEFLKRMSESMLGVEKDGNYPVVLVHSDGLWQIGFRIETLENGLIAVFIPGVPNANSGAVFFVSPERISLVEIAPARMLKCLKRLGAGSSALLREAQFAENKLYPKPKDLMNTQIKLFAVLCGLTVISPAFAGDKPIHPEADRLLHETSSRIASAKALSFKAEVWEDVIVANHKVTTTKTVEIQLRRPNRIQVEIRSPLRNRGFWYDGHSLTLLDRVGNLYGTVGVPETIDEVIDAANDKFGVNFPLEDFLVSDPYASAMEGIRGGAYFGKVSILGTPCHHIAFSADKVDWQLWVTDDGKALPKKLVITYKEEPGQPQVTAIFTDWNLKRDFSDKTFVFTPPKGAAKVEILPAADDTE